MKLKLNKYGVIKEKSLCKFLDVLNVNLPYGAQVLHKRGLDMVACIEMPDIYGKSSEKVTVKSQITPTGDQSRDPNQLIALIMVTVAQLVAHEVQEAVFVCTNNKLFDPHPNVFNDNQIHFNASWTL